MYVISSDIFVEKFQQKILMYIKISYRLKEKGFFFLRFIFFSGWVSDSIKIFLMKIRVRKINTQHPVQ